MRETPETEKPTAEVFADMIKGESIQPKSAAEKGPIGILSDIVTGDIDKDSEQS